MIGQPAERDRFEMKAFILAALFLLAFAMVALHAGGCAHTKLDQANQAITAAEQLQTAAIQGFERYDGQHQQDIVAAARTRAEADANLRAYRAKRDIVNSAVLKLAAVTTVARTTLTLVSGGAKGTAELDKALSDMSAAGSELSSLFTDLDLSSSPGGK